MGPGSSASRRPAAVRGGVVVCAVITCALLLLAGACSSDDTSTAEPAAPATTTTTDASSTTPDEPLEVEVRHETYVDETRPTPAGGDRPASTDRTIVTRIAQPTAGGPYPLLVLSHGATGHPDEYAETIPMWASHGYVVVAPIFPATNRDAPEALTNIADVANQPGDVSFVIDQILAATDDPDDPLHGLVDPDAIGVVGHSLGGATTWAASFDDAVRDDRIDSTVIFSAFTSGMPDGNLRLDSGLPLLVFHGNGEDIPIESDLNAWEQAVAPKWFVTLEGADHRLAFTDEPSPWDDLVTRTVLDFWRGTLLGDDAALDRVTEDATDPDLSTVRTD